ncbi:FUSC family protein [Sphingomonas sp. UYP23]
MKTRFAHPHVRAVFATEQTAIPSRAVVIGIVGVAVPVLIGWWIGPTQIGLGIGLGAMLLGGGTREARGVTEAIGLSLAAVGAALAFAGTPWGDAALIVVAGVAALAGGYSRRLAVASVQFCVYLVLCISVFESASDLALAAAAFALGAVWNIVLCRMIGRQVAADPPSPHRHKQQIVAFRKRVRGWNAWQYCVRLTAGLAAASIARHAWSAHHGAWLLITVVLLTGRTFERFPVKLTQRTLGVTLGVVLTWSILAVTQTLAATVVAIAALASAMPVLRARSYLLYSAAMTPMILLVLDFDHPSAAGLLLDRLIATLAGSAIVLLVNLAMDWVLARGAQPAARAI